MRAPSSSSTASPITRRPPSRSSSTSPRPTASSRHGCAATLPLPIGGPYDLDTLASDALALIDRLGAQVDLVGHDWGGMITYTVCAAAPSHVCRAVTLAIPRPATFLRSLAHSKQWKKSWYMGLFQLPGAD